MKLHTLGVAPSHRSSGPKDARVPWCEQSPSGQKVRHLTKHLDPVYENASAVWPGANRRSDRLPWKRCGYDLLRRLADDATSGREALVLGLQYWRPVLEWLRRENIMAFDGRAPIGEPLFVSSSAETGGLTVQLLPHPRNWPEVMARHRTVPIYRGEMLRALERQRLRSGGRAPRLLLAKDTTGRLPGTGSDDTLPTIPLTRGTTTIVIGRPHPAPFYRDRPR